MAAASPVDYLRLKLLSILEGPGTATLTFILKHGTNAHTSNLSLLDYLNNLPQGSEENYCRLSNKGKVKAFTDSEKKVIESDLSWDSFDVSLLCKAIKLSCKNIAELSDNAKWENLGCMEGLIRKIKDERNRLVHERALMTQNEFDARVRELEDLFLKALEAAQIRYSISEQEVDKKKKYIEENIKTILECFTKEEILRLDSIGQLLVFKTMVIRNLRKIYEMTQNFDPLSFLSSSETFIDVQTIFTKPLMKKQYSKTEIHYLDIVNYTQSLGQPTHPPQFSKHAHLQQTSHPTPPPQSSWTTHQPQSLHTHPSQTGQPTASPEFTNSVRPQLVLINGVAGCGKTTLLTFILSEWIKDERDRRIKHLYEYDFVLHIPCRQINGASLQEFFEQILPEAVAFRPNLMTLLRNCKILYLIDGLDERNNLSRQLVEDILCQCEMVPGVTIICTSRPEVVVDFVQSVPLKYGKGIVMLEGISPNNRTEFVLKYYNWLDLTGSSDPARLKQVMESVVWKDHLSLPLNLLFLVTLFHDDPDSVKENISQTSLYLAIHKWCIEKLHYRISMCSQSKGIDRVSREEGIKKVLNMVYEVSLAGLLQDRLSLRDEDMLRLRKYCKEENLPREEVLGGFFSLRQFIINRKIHQTYYAPHKGLQEFFAAKHIVNYLGQTSASGKSVKRTFYHIVGLHHRASGDIRRLIHHPSPTKLKKYSNLLLHVVGLLSQPDAPSLPRAMNEAVDLLAETEVTSCNHWLSLLKATEFNQVTLKCIARHVSTIYLRRKGVNWSELYREVARHTCTKVFLVHHYQQPDPTSSSTSVLCALPLRCLEKFAGYLNAEGITLLQKACDLKDLRLAVSGDQDAPTILSALEATCPSFPHLKHLSLHVPVEAITLEMLTTPLPDVTSDGGFTRVNLALSGVDEKLLEKTCRITAVLQPRGVRYWTIRFPNSRLEVAAWRSLLNLLSDAGTRVEGWIVVPETTPITDEEARELRNLAETNMLGGFIKQSKNKLWW
ncbi:uncharacterized protein LOC135094237 isoform X2 [Scylla paramamosain]|uniref:uncharacterized protein LOC135094237 isoform X2 n=1 Tax=Scylla paramamosain TaxID=85552 RepID=UPI003082AF8C